LPGTSNQRASCQLPEADRRVPPNAQQAPLNSRAQSPDLPPAPRDTTAPFRHTQHRCQPTPAHVPTSDSSCSNTLQHWFRLLPHLIRDATAVVPVCHCSCSGVPQQWFHLLLHLFHQQQQLFQPAPAPDPGRHRSGSTHPRHLFQATPAVLPTHHRTCSNARQQQVRRVQHPL
jgi:hypothetical protein